MDNLFQTGIRPKIDAYLAEQTAKKRDYGQYWSASSAGYCMRKVIFDRLGVEPTSEDARKTRVFEAGHIFHEWLQRITKDSGLSVAQEVELQDEELMIRGHFDDLILITGEDPAPYGMPDDAPASWRMPEIPQHLILYDYKTQNSRAFQWQKKNGSSMSYFHKMQLGTYMYMLRKSSDPEYEERTANLTEARILKISKDDLCMTEERLMWSPQLEKDVVGYWRTLNGYWKNRKMPNCTCADFEGGFMAKPAYNPYYFNDAPCSLEWLRIWQEKEKQHDAVQA